MSLLLAFIAVTICFTVSETKERVASLVVLPPLVLGYDELYRDSQEDWNTYASKKRIRTTPPKRKETTALPTENRERKIVPNTTPITEKIVRTTEKITTRKAVTTKKTERPKKTDPPKIKVTTKKKDQPKKTDPLKMKVTTKQKDLPKNKDTTKKTDPPKMKVTTKKKDPPKKTDPPKNKVTTKKKDPPKKTDPPKKKDAPKKKDNEKGKKKSKRTFIIDTKGRRNFRRDYRNLLKDEIKKEKNCEICQLLRYEY